MISPFGEVDFSIRIASKRQVAPGTLEAFFAVARIATWQIKAVAVCSGHDPRGVRSDEGARHRYRSGRQFR